MALRTADDVFIDFCGRRRGILRALTSEVESFYAQCSPEKENLCLYGYADGSWEVTLPCEEVPPELPEPALGINFARDGMQRQDWLCLVAVHSDSWLMAIAFYNGARLNAEGRRQLFNDINSLPTCYELVSGRAAAKTTGTQLAQIPKRQPPDVAAAAAAAADDPGAKRSRPAPSGQRPRYVEHDEDAEGASGGDSDSDGGGYDGGGGSDPCPNCGRLYRSGEFWIQCDFCDRWYDGRCVQMTPQKAERSSTWQCPLCTGRKH